MNDKANPESPSQKILEAAFKCISLKGYANVSLRDIAEEADVALSQLNYYYRNKEGLFIEVVNRLAQKYLAEIEDNLKKGLSSKENLSYLIKYFQDILREKPELFKILFDLTSMALWSEPLKDLLNHLFINVSDMIERYILSKEDIESYSSKALSRVIFGAFFGTSIQPILAQGEEDMINSLSAIQIFLNSNN